MTPQNGKDKAARALNRWQRQLQELQRSLHQQSQHLNGLALQVERVVKDQDERQSMLDDIREVFPAEALPEVPRSAYQQLVRRIREVVRLHVPRYATVLVASKGDPDLLQLNGRLGWHFPRNAQGQYAGYYPACSIAAIAHLEALRALGGQYLLFPCTAFWWLDHYRAFKQHLEQHYRLIVRGEDTGLIYSLRAPAVSSPQNPSAQLGQLVAEFQTRFDRDPAILDCHSEMDLAQRFPQLAVFLPPTGEGPLPYLDHSVDIVVAPAAGSGMSSEARRVAMAACVTIKDVARNGAEPALTVEWLPGCPATQLPTVSIILPCGHGVASTATCLRSLWETLPRGFRGEIILVGDPPSDALFTALQEGAAKERRVKVVGNRRQRGFADSCNRGAREAKGEFLIFLNQQFVLLAGWLPPLLRVFRDFPQAGAVGGKLIAPDGTLQEAGGMVFRNGWAMGFGCGDTNLAAPFYNFVREVDYCSGALLATRRSLWKQSDGFDTEYSQGSCADLDYCFRIREQGCRVYYQPESAVVHYVGNAAGADGLSQPTMCRVINDAKFMDRWQSVLKQQLVWPEKLDEQTLQTLAARTAARIVEGKAR